MRPSAGPPSVDWVEAAARSGPALGTSVASGPLGVDAAPAVATATPASLAEAAGGASGVGSDPAPVALGAAGEDPGRVAVGVGRSVGVAVGRGVVRGVGFGVGGGVGFGQSPAIVGGTWLDWLWYRKPSASPSWRTTLEIPTLEYCQDPLPRATNSAQNGLVPVQQLGG
jgi:hypothetical protein